MVLFDVDNRIIRLSKHQLDCIKDSVFARLARENQKELKNKKGAFYVDGHNHMVSSVLQWLDRRILPNNRVILLKLVKEAQLYGLQEMKAEVLKKLKRVSVFNFDGIYLFEKEFNREVRWMFYLSFHEDEVVELVEGNEVHHGVWSIGDGDILLSFPTKKIKLMMTFNDQDPFVKSVCGEIFFGSFIKGIDTELAERLAEHEPFEFKHDTVVNTSTIVSFNVGGSIVNLSEYSLKKFPNSLFTMLYENKGKMKIERDSNGRIVINRDSKYISFIIDFMEKESLPVTKFYQTNVKTEASFYLLQELVVAIQNSSMRFDGVYLLYCNHTSEKFKEFITFNLSKKQWACFPSGDTGIWTGNSISRMSVSIQWVYNHMIIKRNQIMYCSKFEPFYKLPEILQKHKQQDT